tara:strand:- start:1315 stop:1635 length:321 start_codon:yes stop_codon:yes gene_type:complete
MAIIAKVRVPRNLPMTVCEIGIGFMNKSSNVPNLISSEKLLMVMAGIRKRNTQGARRKNLSKSANPYSKILKGPLNTQRNRPVKIKKRPMTKYPIGDVKNACISLL